MTKRNLLEDIKSNPQRFYRAPSDVNRDRRFNDEERMQILSAWEQEARAENEEFGESETRLRQLADAIAEVERRVPARRGSEPESSTGVNKS